VSKRKAMFLSLVALAAAVLPAGWMAPASATTATARSADLVTRIATLPTAQVTGYQYFAVTVTNRGHNRALNVVIKGGTPSRSTFYCVTGIGAACGSVPSDVTCAAPTSTAPITCKLTAPLTDGSSVTVWMGFTHGFFLPGQAYCDSASASSRTPDPNPANNTATACARVV
jgi:hypothetical protein